MKKHLFIIIITIIIIFCITSDYNNLIEAFDDMIFENVPNNVLLDKFYRNDPSDYQGSPKLDLNLYEKEQPYNLSLQDFNNKFKSNIKGLSNRIAAIGIDTSTQPKYLH